MTIGPLLFQLAGVLAICLLLGGAPVQSSPGPIFLKEVFRYSKFSWFDSPEGEHNPAAVFSADGKRVYLTYQSKAEVRVLDWERKQVVRKKNYKKHFVHDRELGKKSCTLDQWKLLPGTSYALMDYCDSLVLVSSESLEVVKVLVYSNEVAGIDFEFSATLGYVGVHIYDREQREYRIRAYSTGVWQIAGEWQIASSYGNDIAITADGHYLALSFQLQHPRQCGIELRELPTGRVKIRRDIGTRAEEGYCPSVLSFIPGPGYLLATSPLKGGISIWNVETGTLVREIGEERPILPFSLAVSPTGRWIAASLRDDPQETPEGQQDFKIWDVRTGEVVYETPLQRWRWPYWTRKQVSPLYLRFSPDGRHLLVLKYKELQVFEIVPQS